MKRNSALSLVWLVSSPLFAADLSPSYVIPNEGSLGRPGIKLQNIGDLSLGLRFEQAKNFRLSPDDEAVSDSVFIQRELQIGARIWSGLDLGLAVRANQESQTHEEVLQIETDSHKSKPLTTGLWLQYHLLESSSARTSLSLQYLPGQGSASTFHQASQDRSIIGLSQEWSPSSWFQGAVYVLGSRRQNELYRGSYQLGQETAWGLRLAMGPDVFHVLADAEARQIEVKTEREGETLTDKTQGRLYRLGLGSLIGNFDMRVATSIPDTRRYLGVPERSLIFSLSYRFGQERKSEDLKDEAKISSDTATSQESEAAAPSKEDEEAPKSGNNSLEESELDEFQILERKLQEEAQNPQESPEEVAERELRTLRDAEKVAEEAQKQEEERLRAEDYKRIQKELESDEKLYNEYRLDVEDDVNQYALPDAEELNWKGLQ